MNGIIIINKEKDYTSNDVVKKVKKILNEKVGHTGTLDPNATGVLPLLVGKATKLSKYLINHDKEYEAVLKLGEKTSTADGEGKILENKKVPNDSLNDEYVEKCLQTFIGKLEQIPPMYSAIKVNGKKLYQYARSGESVEIEPRLIEIYDIKLLEINKDEKEIKFYVKCSKGTYIRTLCEDIANRLDTVGYMKELNRISVGEFNIKDSITIGELENNVKNNDYSSIIYIEKFFENSPEIIIDDDTIFNKYLNGVEIKKENISDGVCRVYYNNKFVGICEVKNGNIKRDIVED